MHVKHKTNSENGVEYDIVETINPVESTCSVADKRIVIDGKVALETMNNSWKFGKQIQIVAYGKVKAVEQRAANRGYDRIEIALPYEVGKELILELAKKLECNELKIGTEGGKDVRTYT